MDTTLGLAQHYCEMHDYISKYIYSDIGYDCQVLFEEGFWEKIGSSIKTAANNVWKFLVKIWNDVINFIQNFFHKSRKVLNELANNTRKYISEIIAFIQKVIREKSTDTNGKANGINKVSELVMDIHRDWTTVDGYRAGLQNTKSKNSELKTDIIVHSKIKGEANTANQLCSIGHLIAGNIANLNTDSTPKLQEAIDAIKNKYDEDVFITASSEGIGKLAKKKVDECCELFDAYKDYQETYCFPNDAGFYSTIGTLNDLSAKYAHYINETYGLFNAINGTAIDQNTTIDKTEISNGVKEIKELLSLSTSTKKNVLDDEKNFSANMVQGFLAISGKGGTTECLRKLVEVLNEAISNLITKLKEIDKHRKDKDNSTAKYTNLEKINWSLDTKYKPDEIERKGEAEIIKFANNNKTVNQISEAISGIGLDNIQSNLLLTVNLTNSLRIYFTYGKNYFEGIYEKLDDLKKELVDDKN